MPRVWAPVHGVYRASSDFHRLAVSSCDEAGYSRMILFLFLAYPQTPRLLVLDHQNWGSLDKINLA